MPITSSEIKTICESYTPKLIEIIKELVAVPSVSVLDSQSPISKKIISISEDLGFAAKVVYDPAYPDERPVFVGCNMTGTDSIVVTSGYGTVDLRDAVGDYDPFTPIEKDGRLYGGGAWKNKGNVALSLIAKRILTDLGHKHLIKLLFDNQIGAKPYDGIRAALKQGLNGSFHLSSVPLLEVDGKALVMNGSRGVVRLQVNIEKVQPNDDISRWLKTKVQLNPLECFYEFWNEFKEVFADDQPDPHFHDTVTNDITLVQVLGGNDFGMAPKEASAKISCHITHSFNLDKFLARAQAIVDKNWQDTPIQFMFSVVEYIPACTLNNSKWFGIYQENIKKTLGKDSEVIHDFYLNACRLFQEKGIDGGFVATLTGGNQNTFNEYVELGHISEYLELAVRSYLQFSGIEIID
jgi:acetylornithine deacetylase/succinyl-diaminopimelate desuccinylase-like protein